MGITFSDLKENSALSVVGAFIITRSSYEYIFVDDEQRKKDSMKKLILGAVLYESGKLLDKLETNI